MTPNHYYLDIEQTFKLEDILNNFAGGLNVWKASVLKYTNRASLKHDNPLDCLNKALNCVNKDHERILKEIKQGFCIVEKLDPIDLEIHKKALNPDSYNKIDKAIKSIYTKHTLQKIIEGDSNHNKSAIDSVKDFFIGNKEKSRSNYDRKSVHKMYEWANDPKQYKIFLTDIYKWVIGEVSFDEIKSKIQKQIDIFSKFDKC